jgi:hypothetical protein
MKKLNAVPPAARLRGRPRTHDRKPDAAQLWKHLEDILVPRLSLDVVERAVYSHLVRHSRLEGRRKLRFSIDGLAQGTRLSHRPVRSAVRSLIGKAALRLIERTKAGHVVEVLLPHEIRGLRGRSGRVASFDVEAADFYLIRELNDAIHQREGGRCFYCLRELARRFRCLDHVVPQARSGRNSYRNLVSCCLDCNSQKGEMPAEDFLRQLYRQGRLNAHELAERLRAIAALAAGKRKPAIVGAGLPRPLGSALASPARRGRSRLNPAA